MSYQHQQQQEKNKALVKPITGAADNGSGMIRITAPNHTFRASDHISISGVGGTVEANAKNWRISVISGSTFDLRGSVFTHPYTSGGTATRTQS